MSKTLATEIATRALEVTSPLNRAIALSAALRRHGFDPGIAHQPEHPIERAQLVAWLLATYAKVDDRHGDS